MSDRLAQFQSLRARGWTNRRIAKRYGPSHRYVSEIINGRIRSSVSVSAATFKRLQQRAKETGVSMGRMIEMACADITSTESP